MTAFNSTDNFPVNSAPAPRPKLERQVTGNFKIGDRRESLLSMPPKKIGVPSVTFGSEVIIDPILSSMSSNDSCDETDENHTPNGVPHLMRSFSSSVAPDAIDEPKTLRPSLMRSFSSRVIPEEIEEPKTPRPSLMRSFSSSVAQDATDEPKTPHGVPPRMRSLSSGIAPATPEAMNGVTFDEINTPRVE